MNNEYITRPVWTPAIKGRRAETWHRRYVSAWDLASMIDGENVTETEYTAALKLLDSIQRYALADAAEWERENSSESYCNSRYHKERENQLNKRRAALNTRLDRYGLKLTNYGLYPTITAKDNSRDYNLLHWFD